MVCSTSAIATTARPWRRPPAARSIYFLLLKPVSDIARIREAYSGLVGPGGRTMQPLAAVEMQNEFVGWQREFVAVVRFLALARDIPNAVALAQQARAPDRVIAGIKAAQDPI